MLECRLARSTTDVSHRPTDRPTADRDTRRRHRTPPASLEASELPFCLGTNYRPVSAARCSLDPATLHCLLLVTCRLHELAELAELTGQSRRDCPRTCSAYSRKMPSLTFRPSRSLAGCDGRVDEDVRVARKREAASHVS